MRMTERAVLQFFRLILHLFFRRVVVIGEDRMPVQGPLVIVANHENALLDPFLLLCVSPRPVRFLAKATLFRNPMVAPFLRLLMALPVARRQDEGSDMSRNLATFEACEHILLDGGALSLFPEGVSHDAPHLMPLKTGTARIIGRAFFRGARPTLLPAGLLYKSKSAFRSNVTISFGVPIPYEDLSWGGGEEPAAVEALTERIREALVSLTVNAERWEDIRFLERIRGMALGLAGVEGDDPPEAEVLRALVNKFYQARLERPTRVHALVTRAKAYLRMLDLLELRDADVARETTFGAALSYTWKRLAVIVLGYPAALYGWLFNFLPYFLSGRLAVAAAKERDVVATYKIYGGLIFFPLFYLGQGVLIWWAGGPWWGICAVALGGPCGLWATRYYAIRAQFVHLAAAAITLRTQKETGERLRQMRAEVLEALAPLVEMYK